MANRGFVLALIGAAAIVAAGAGGFYAMQLTARAPQLEAVPAVAAAPATDAAVASPEPAAAPAERLTPVPEAEPVREVEAVPARTPSRTRPSRQNRPSRRTADVVEGAAPSARPVTPAPVEPVTPATVDHVVDLPPAAPAKSFEEITIDEASVIGIALDTAVTSETAKVEDKVSARVTRDVTVDGRTAIPAGARLEGNVTLVESGGKFRNRSRIGVRFTTAVIGDRTRVPIQTETIFREGDAPGAEATSKVGGSAVVGAILGAVVGGKKGAAIGGAAGAAGGTAVVMAGDRNHAVLAAGSPLTVRLTAPATVVIERE